MAIKHGSKVDKSYSSASMTDLMFLLLLFLLIATTLINPNALKLMLPKSANQLKDKAITTVSIQQAGSGYNYYVELEKVSGIDGVEQALRVRTSCTCTKASFSKRPVAPGERGVVKVIYEPHKKEPGAFSKVIQIFSTSIEGRNVLTVRGNSIDVKK